MKNVHWSLFLIVGFFLGTQVPYAFRLVSMLLRHCGGMP